jgi:hypothetical protein
MYNVPFNLVTYFRRARAELLLSRIHQRKEKREYLKMAIPLFARPGNSEVLYVKCMAKRKLHHGSHDAMYVINGLFL